MQKSVSMTNNDIGLQQLHCLFCVNINDHIRQRANLLRAIFPFCYNYCSSIRNLIHENDKKDRFLLVCINRYLHMKRDNSRKKRRQMSGFSTLHSGQYILFFFLSTQTVETKAHSNMTGQSYSDYKR